MRGVHRPHGGEGFGAFFLILVLAVVGATAPSSRHIPEQVAPAARKLVVDGKSSVPLFCPSMGVELVGEQTGPRHRGGRLVWTDASGAEIVFDGYRVRNLTDQTVVIETECR